MNARGELISRVLSKLQAMNFDVSRDDRFVVLQDPPPSACTICSVA